MISRDSFCAPEIDIFQAVSTWAERTGCSDLKPIVSAVRLQLMTLVDLLNVVRPSNLVCADAILDAIKVKNESRDMELNYRGCLSKYE